MSKTTENYGLTKPEVGEFFSLETWNENMDKIDGELKKREDAQKESDNSLMNPEFTEAKERKNLTSGEKIHLMLGKIARFFTDLKTVAFTGNYKDLSNKPTSLPASDVSAWAKAKTKPTYTKAEVGLGNVDNTADSAKSVKYATSAGNATKVNNHTVNADVPSGAKFTDTTYGVATTTKTGIVKPDGKTITADKDGTLHGADIDGITITRDDATKVIALAITLQDKIGTIGNKVDKKNIVNNQTTTVAGFALDARQANPNIDGTLAKQLSDLNGSLNLCVKRFEIPVNKSIAIPCLNCIIFYNGSNGGKFSISTTVGYASDATRSRISYINGNETNGLKLSYSEEGTHDSMSGIFIIENTNLVNVARIAVVGIKNFSIM